MISPVLLSEVTLPPGHPHAGVRGLVYGFVIHHPQGAVLMDTGVGTGRADVDARFETVHHDFAEALAAAGVELADVRLVINSHLHFDHCGNNRLLRGVPIVVQRAEHEVAHTAGYTVPEWVDFPGVDWLLVDGEAEVLPGIRVIPTPGHTPGHQSTVVSTPRGTEVIAAQAVYDPDELDAEASIEPLSPPEADQTVVAARRIKEERPHRVFFSHDERVWVPG